MKLVVLANREPVRRVEGRYEVALGGLAAALYPVLARRGGVWVAWDPGGSGERIELKDLLVVRVPLSKRRVAGYYRGYANQALWPLMHLFLERFVYKRGWWRDYRAANRSFAEAALKEGGERALYWVHDYHLSLAPALLREGGARRVGLFWHIPWPPLEVLEVLPEAEALVRGMLGADLIGFHTETYAERFLEAARALAGARVREDAAVVAGRWVRVRALPIGVDVAGLKEARSRVLKRAKTIRKAYAGRRILVGADRLDYTKGILERIRAFRRFLERWPEFQDRVVFLQLTAPSREAVPAYRGLKSRLFWLAEATERRFPGAFVHHYGALSRDELLAHFAAADLALVTPLRDGMNLVALEYGLVSEGLPLLSRFAGAAQYVRGALLLNPYDEAGTAEVIHQGLTLSAAEHEDRRKELLASIERLDVGSWAETFLRELS